MREDCRENNGSTDNSERRRLEKVNKHDSGRVEISSLARKDGE
jgi:hypothetical protein